MVTEIVTTLMAIAAIVVCLDAAFYMTNKLQKRADKTKLYKTMGWK